MDKKEQIEKTQLLRNKGSRNHLVSGAFGTSWGRIPYGLLVRRLSPKKNSIISARFGAFRCNRFGKVSVVSVQPCPFQSYSGSKRILQLQIRIYIN